MEVGDIVTVNSIFGTKWKDKDAGWKITMRVTWMGGDSFLGAILDGVPIPADNTLYCYKSAIIPNSPPKPVHPLESGIEPALLWADDIPIVSKPSIGKPLLGEADPELERLLAEEEMIEAKALAAKNDLKKLAKITDESEFVKVLKDTPFAPPWLVPLVGQIVKVSGIPATSHPEGYEHYVHVSALLPAQTSGDHIGVPRFWGRILGGGYLAGEKVWYHYTDILAVPPKIGDLEIGQAVTLMGVPGCAEHDGKVHHGTFTKLKGVGKQFWAAVELSKPMTLYYNQENLVPDGFVCTPADWALIQNKSPLPKIVHTKGSGYKISTAPTPPIRVRIEG